MLLLFEPFQTSFYDILLFFMTFSHHSHFELVMTFWTFIIASKLSSHGVQKCQRSGLVLQPIYINDNTHDGHEDRHSSISSLFTVKRAAAPLIMLLHLPLPHYRAAYPNDFPRILHGKLVKICKYDFKNEIFMDGYMCVMVHVIANFNMMLSTTEQKKKSPKSDVAEKFQEVNLFCQRARILQFTFQNKEKTLHAFHSFFFLVFFLLSSITDIFI